MRILQLVTERQYRGAEVFAANLSVELIKLGHEIIFVGLYKNPSNTLVVPGALNQDVAQKKEGNFSLQLVKDLRKVIIRTKPDIIQCNGSDTLKYMVAVSFLIPRIPILYRNISMISEWVTDRPKKFLYKNIFKRISHVSSVGEQAVADLIKTFDYPLKKTSVIRRGIPMSYVDSFKARKNLKDKLGLDDCHKLVMHVGNFSPEKNHLFLLDIFTEIKKVNPNIKLVCVGDGITFNQIKQEVHLRNLESFVYLLGFQKEIPELLAAADCLVLCSKVEGVPGVILEAAVQKIPAVATNVGGVKEVLLNNETGFIISNFDKKEFIKKLFQLIDDPALRYKMGERAFLLVSEQYNPLKNAIRFENLYKNLIR